MSYSFEYYIIKIIGILLSFATLTFSNSAFADSTENHDTIITDQTIILSNEEYEKLISSFERENDVRNLIISNPNNNTIFSKDTHKERVEWAGITSRSTYSHTTSGNTKIYTNKGNSSTARSEFNRMGSGEVTAYVSGDKITYVKSTPSGDVRLYMSSSQTADAERPTLSFLKDKIRFLGN